MCPNCLLNIRFTCTFSFYMHVFTCLRGRMFTFQIQLVYHVQTFWKNCYTLLKPVAWSTNCAGTFRSKNPGLIRKQCKAGPFEIRQQRSRLAHLSVKYIIFACLQDIYSICLVFELHLSSFISSANASLSYLS